LVARASRSQAARRDYRRRRVRSITGRFRLALFWIATGIVLGAFLPALGLAVIAAFIPFYWLPIRGEIERRAKRRRGDMPSH
jgi:hypothetical protein